MPLLTQSTYAAPHQGPPLRYPLKADPGPTAPRT